MLPSSKLAEAEAVYNCMMRRIRVAALVTGLEVRYAAHAQVCQQIRIADRNRVRTSVASVSPMQHVAHDRTP